MGARGGAPGRGAPPVVLFDAAGTLFASHPPFPELIAERAGYGPAGLAAVRGAVEHVGSTVGWPDDQPDRAARLRAWADFVAAILERAAVGGAGAARGGLAESVAWTVLEPRSYRPFPEVTGVLARLAGAGTRVGIVSNFDDLLFDILRHTGLAAAFPVVVTSYRTGVCKPDPRIFHAALRATGAVAADTWYVGDSPYSDMGGARAAGLRGVLVDRDGVHRDYAGTRIASLTGLVPLLGLGGDASAPAAPGSAAPATPATPGSATPAKPGSTTPGP